MNINTNGLLSKWGFCDGELLDTIEAIPDEQNTPELLCAVIKRFVIPKLQHTITIVTLTTAHNPIRAASVDGVDTTKLWYDSKLQDKIQLNPSTITVDDNLIIQLAKELSRQ